MNIFEVIEIMESYAKKAWEAWEAWKNREDMWAECTDRVFNTNDMVKIKSEFNHWWEENK